MECDDVTSTPISTPLHTPPGLMWSAGEAAEAAQPAPASPRLAVMAMPAPSTVSRRNIALPPSSGGEPLLQQPDRREGSAPSSAERIGAAMMFGRSRVMPSSATVRPDALGRSSNPRILHHDGATPWQKKSRAHSSWSDSSTDRTTASPAFGRKSTPPKPQASSANERTPCGRT